MDDKNKKLPLLLSSAFLVFAVGLFVSNFSFNLEPSREVVLAQVSNADSYQVARDTDGVKQLQEYLLDQGYYKGSIHGNLDSNTKLAIKDWQKELGIIQTGTISSDWQPVDRSMMPPEDEVYTACDADFDGNGVINVNDLLSFMGAFGTMPNNDIPEDIDSNGMVNITDLLIFMSLFGQSANCPKFIEIDSGFNFTCGISNSNKVYCWGDNVVGQLGNGDDSNDSSANSSVPVEIDLSDLGIDNYFLEASAGHVDACAIHDTGQVYTWGYQSALQTTGLGIGSTTLWATSPVEIAASDVGIENSFQQVSCGGSANCGVHETGELYCWGADNAGSVGNGGLSEWQVSYPTAVDLSLLGIENSFIEVSSGLYSTVCAIHENEKLYCWGYDLFGGVGNGGGGQINTVSPVEVDMSSTDLTNSFIKVSPGWKHTCAIHETGNLLCWGAAGLLGSNTWSNQYSPILVDTTYLGIENSFVSVSVGNDHTCAIHETGELYCWGINDSGQLGTGNTDYYSLLTPINLSELGIENSFVSVSSGNNHTCAIHENLETYCWGKNYSGQLGNGSTTTQFTPVPVDMTNVE